MAAPRDHRARALVPRQVNKVITDIKNLKDGDDLHNWSASSRKELTSAIKPFQVGTDTKSLVHVPNLALIVASPVVRAYFTTKPDATTANSVHADISKKAMKQIATWLKHYVKHFEAHYAINVDHYDPNAQEIIDVINYTRGDEDTMLEALADRLSYLCRYHKVPEAVEMAYAKLLVDEKFIRLLAAVKDIAVKEMLEYE
ncbi:hypothetical protein BDU57DRAFT_585441 [Ampelomyces quisqualis]|uniref:Uncharacterized protein n=1 Tax=Ampelomyces quisqualis TaxID=50730 RepID=A0A6A5QTV3_AMPQU|nr:hypothetical protein BDU57DRAFT_585441 [Ampelomyces quisqualis]